MCLLRMILGLALLLLGTQGFGRQTSTCACITDRTEAGKQCVLTPGHNQRRIGSVALGRDEVCTEEICSSLYERQRSSYQVRGQYPYTCERFVIDPAEVSDVISCSSGKPTLFNLSLSQQFDNSTGVSVPRSYNPLKLDINRCEIGSIANTVRDHIAALKSKGCSCENLVINFNSHGLVRGNRHVTQCDDTQSGVRRTVDLNSVDLMQAISAELTAQQCKDSSFVFDSCYSGQVVKDVRTVAIDYPLFTASNETCTAPGHSNFWQYYNKWCRQCDSDRDGSVTVGEIQSCIPKLEGTLLTLRSGTTMCIVDGPWAMSSRAGANTNGVAFTCERPIGTARRSGLQLREETSEDLPAHLSRVQ